MKYHKKFELWCKLSSTGRNYSSSKVMKNAMYLAWKAGRRFEIEYETPERMKHIGPPIHERADAVRFDCPWRPK